MLHSQHGKGGKRKSIQRAKLVLIQDQHLRVKAWMLAP